MFRSGDIGFGGWCLVVRVVLRLLREAARNAVKPVTITYPAGGWPGTRYSSLPEGLRGKPEIDGERCTGCGACSVQCSSGANEVFDREGVRVVRISLGMCLMCGRCEDICPEEAIRLTKEFELAYSKPEGEPRVENEIRLKACKNCGKTYTTTKHLEAIKRRVSESIDPSVKEVVLRDMGVYLDYCPDCRRLFSFRLKTHSRKFY